jgi:hypothetical protein
LKKFEGLASDIKPREKAVVAGPIPSNLPTGSPSANADPFPA